MRWRVIRKPATMVDLTQHQRDYVVNMLFHLSAQGLSPMVKYLGIHGRRGVAVLDVDCGEGHDVRSYKIPPCAPDPVGHATRRKAPMPWLSP